MVLASTLVFASCKKKGCTDAMANNYDSEASKDDESCTYSARGTFWYEQSLYLTMNQAGVTTVELFVGDVSAGTAPVGDYAGPATPDCGAAKTISVVKNIGTSKTKDLTWELRDQSGNALYSGTWSSTGLAEGSCDIIKIQ